MTDLAPQDMENILSLFSGDFPIDLVVDEHLNIQQAQVSPTSEVFLRFEHGRPFMEQFSSLIDADSLPGLEKALGSAEPTSFDCPACGDMEGFRFLFIPFDKSTRVLIRPASSAQALERQLESEVQVRQETEKHLLLTQRFELVGQIAAGIAHEINTPLQYVWNNLDFIQVVLDRWQKESSTGSLDPKTHERLETEAPEAIADSFEGLKKIRRIIKLVVDYAKPGRRTHVPLDVNMVLQDAIDFTRTKWRFVAKMEVETDPDLPLYSASAEDLSQSLVNLIVNAAESIEDRYGEQHPVAGRIMCSTSLTDKAIEIRISDNGSGIPVQLQQRIFAPFFTTKDSRKQTGMGLAMVYAGIVNQHGGSVVVSSDGHDGCEFTLQMPLANRALYFESEPT